MSRSSEPERPPRLHALAGVARRLSAAALAVSAATAGQAQVLPFEALTLRHGLPQSQVTSVVQDRQGYLWVGTWGGLARFNGDSFTHFLVSDGLPSSRVHELVVDSAGVLWVATAAGLARRDDPGFAAISDPLLGHARCRAIAEDRAGRLWIGTDVGILLLQRGDLLPVQRPPSPSGHDFVVYDLLPDGGAMLAVTSLGLFVCESTGQPTRIDSPPVPPGTLRVAARTAEGLWVGTLSAGLWRKEGGRWQPLTEEEFPGQEVYRLSVGTSGTLYAATNDAGLLRRPSRGGRFELLDTSRGLPSNVTNCAYEDREGNLWVGTDIGGLARLGPTAASTFDQRQGLPSACVFGVTRASPDSLWIGTLAGAARLQPGTPPRVLETVTRADGLRNALVWKVVVDPRGDEWMLTDSALLVRRRGERRFVEPGPAVPVPRIEQHDVAVDGAGRVWLAGRDATGTMAMRDASLAWTVWRTFADGTPLPVCRAAARRRAGGVWVAAADGVLVCDGSTVERHPEPPPLPGGAYFSVVLEDSRGRLWVGSDAGLAVHELTGSWRLVGGLAGTPIPHVYAIGEDAEGTIWVGTTRGFLRLRADGTVEPFTAEQGLGALEANEDGFFLDDAGNVWLSTVAGLTRFSPALEKPNRAQPVAVVESVALPDRRIEAPRALDLSWRERTVTFQIAVLAYRGHSGARYRARLDGLEADWLPLRASGELRYTNLPAGSFRLLVQAVNESGVWGEAVALPLRVNPPFWMTWWFRAGGLLALAAGVLGAHGARTLRLRRRTRELEAAVADRTAALLAANSELERLATHEPVTGLLNRRAILARLDAQFGDGGEATRRFGCVLVDLDNFKRVNDTLGHAAGDAVLREMAGRIGASLRGDDVLGRFGGDEFLVVLPGADAETVEAVARRIAAITVTAGEAEPVVVSASCGAVAVRSGAGSDHTGVVAAADGLLYQAKQAGRRTYRTAVI
jgi:diguanylate cyclase (GGDEF)-like protein